VKIFIGIPTLNGPDRLDRALRAIRAHTDLRDVAVLVSDDCSTPENLELNKNAVHASGVEMLMSSQRLGVSQQWNRLVRHVPDAEICVLLNDDVEVVEDWLDVLAFSLARNPKLGMVSLRCETGVTSDNAVPRPRIDYSEARLLTGGGTLISSGGACFAFRRDDWQAVLGFDERYFCFYEEVDFGVALARERGLFSAFASYPVVLHMGGATVSANTDAPAVLLDSRARFAEKWGTTLDQLRAEFSKRRVPPWVEWNTSWKVNRLP
jgi:GT2 family glycosyltransferase